MSILKLLGEILKVVLPFLRSAAEKAFKKLPKEQQDKLISVSKLVEVVKQTKGKTMQDVANAIVDHTGLSLGMAEEYLIQYTKDKGLNAMSFNQAVELIWKDADNRTETGLKSLWIGMLNLISTTAANIDWEALLLGLGEFVYRSYVKGKIKV